MAGTIGITDKQHAKIAEYEARDKPMTARMQEEYNRLIEARENKELPAGVKDFIQEIWLKNEYGYAERVYTDAMKKGHLCEVESRTLAQKAFGGPFRKHNTTLFSNDYLVGTPDSVDPLEDYKNALNVRTFRSAKAGKDYEWQIRAYMMLLNDNGIECNEGSVIYTLNPDPEEIFKNNERKLKYQYDFQEDNPDYLEALEQLVRNNEIITELTPEQRTKRFIFERDLSMEEEIKERVQLAREYYSTIIF